MATIPVIPNFNGTTPAAPAGFKNTTWQADALNPSDISTYLPNIGSINAQTGTTYTVVIGDQGKLVTLSNTAATAVTLSTAVANGFFCAIENLNTGIVTLTPSSGTINGRTSHVMSQYQGYWLFCDGTNWFSVDGREVGSVNAQVGTTYTTITGDYGKLITFSNAGAIAVTLSSANSSSKFFCAVQNLGVGTATMTPSSGNINGAANLALATGTGGWVFFDGTNWFAVTGGAGGSGGGLNGAVVKTANYTAVSGDNGKLIVFNNGSAVTLTLPSTPPSATWCLFTEDIGAGQLTLSPNGKLLDNAAGSLIIAQNQGVYVSTDGTNYFTERGMGATGGTSTFAVDDLSSQCNSSTNTFTLTQTNTIAYVVWNDLTYFTFSQVSTTLTTNFTLGGTAVVPQTGDTLLAIYFSAVSLGTQPYDLGFQVSNKPPANTLYLWWVFTRPVVFPGNFAGATGKCLTNPAASATFTMQRNGVGCGTIVISTGGVFTFTSSGGATVTFGSGDWLNVLTPNPQDATLSDVAFTLAGTR